MKKTYINVERIPKRVNRWERKRQKNEAPQMSRSDKVNRIKKLAQDMGIKIGGI